MKNKVFIIIPVHNRLDLTKQCLSSFSKQSYPNIEVILVDDGSTDGTRKYFEKKYKNWTLVKGDGTWWWTRSMYEGIEYVLKKANKNDFVLTMNNDCFAKKDYIEIIVNASLANNNAVVGSLVIDAADNKKVINAGIKIDWKNAKIYNLTQKLSDQLDFYRKVKVVDDIDTLPGKGSLIPILVIKDIGNFNHKKLPHYVADYEYFYRAKKKGHKIIISPKAKLFNYTKETGITHMKKKTASYKEALTILFSRKSKLNIVDHLYFLLLHCPKKYLLTNLKQIIKKIFGYSLKTYPLHFTLDIYHLFKYRIFKKE